MPKSAPLGQNFLRDEGFARRIVELVETGRGTLLEIGAGHGILSGMLLERFPLRPVALIEVDANLASELERRFSGPEGPRRGGRIEVIRGDILQIDLGERFPAGPVTLVGNLPYHISKELIDWLIAQREKVDSAVLMLQKDFIDKLLAPCGGKKYNAQSVVFQLLFRPRRRFDVPPGAFAPKPKVVSTVITARPLEPPCARVGDLYAFVRLCFAERRKTLWNNLSCRFDRESLGAMASASGVPATARAEELPPEAFLALFTKASLKK